MPRWRRPTAEEQAVFDRMMARREARPYAPRAATARGPVPSRVVREEAAPILLVGWDVVQDSSGDAASSQMIPFGHVGGVVGQMVGNPTIAPELHGYPGPF